MTSLGRWNPQNLEAQLKAAIAGCSDPMGATRIYLEGVTGIPKEIAQEALARLVHRRASIIAVMGYNRMRYYFLSQEAADTARPFIEADTAIQREKTRQRLLEYHRNLPRPPGYKEAQNAKARARRAANRAARPPKPPKEKPVKPPKEIKLKPSPVPKAKGPAHMPGEMIITAATKITIAPPPVDRWAA